MVLLLLLLVKEFPLWQGLSVVQVVNHASSIVSYISETKKI